MSARIFRVIDTGVRDGRRQIAFDQAMIDARKSGQIPDTIRFLRFPPTALVGRHQALSREIRVDYCRAHDIGIARRITGGGALYFDEGVLGWELVFNRASLNIGTLADLTRTICEAAALGLRRLGVDAAYRPRNDIEVDGRKLSGSGGFFDADTLFFQGTVLVDLNRDDMVAVLNVAQPKLVKRSLDSAAQRVITLKELLGAAPDIAAIQEALLAGFGEHLGIEPRRGQISAEEEAFADRCHADELGTDAFVCGIDEPAAAADCLSGSHTGAGGTITIYVRVAGERIRDVLVTGDFLVTPPRMVFDLEAALRDVPVAQAGAAVERFFERTDIGMLSVAPADFRAAIENALAQ